MVVLDRMYSFQLQYLGHIFNHAQKFPLIYKPLNLAGLRFLGYVAIRVEGQSALAMDVGLR